MKSLTKPNRSRGITMAEYLIILAVVAIAAITITSLFGGTIKNTFANAIDAMNGKKGTRTSTVSGEVTKPSTVTGSMNGEAPSGSAQ